MIARNLHGLSGAEFDFPQYVDLAFPQKEVKKQSAEEIKANIVKRLLEG